ncbi:MAG TPA: hypothetical protein VN636_18715, partial [Acidimicrobiia bacterium]|nr:hypothetical protein [Acidimicrobiia bacterium]
MRRSGWVVLGAGAAGTALAVAAARWRRSAGALSTTIAARNARLVAIGARTGARHAAHRVRVASAPEVR